MAHTKGPWKYKILDGVVYISSHAHLVFEVSSPSTDTGVALCIIPHEDVNAGILEMVKDNAALIAALPDLLEACTFALNVLETFAYGDTDDGQYIKAHLAAAIAKATQEAPNAPSS
jgi:hypothetical protein